MRDPAWLFRRRVAVTCSFDVSQTAESFHAHAIPEGIALRPGDIVLVHDAPATVGFGEHVIAQGSATVFRAGPLARAWTRLVSLFELTELYEVGFAAKEVT